ncbi:MAG: V-type ATPase 116kDa subunit family protein, partial [Bacteroides sp.]
MKKLTFLVYHREYEAFLKTLRDAGVVHIQELERGNLDNPELQDKLILASKIKEALKRLERLGLERSTHPTKSKGKDVLENLEKYEKQLLDLKQELVSHDKLIETLEPWGDFNPKSVERLLEAGLVMNFFICSESNFESDWVEQYNAVKISKDGSRLHFVTLTPPQTEFDINAEHIKLPPYALHTVKDAYKETKEKIEQLEAAIAQIAREDIDSLDLYLKEVQSSIEFSKVVLNTQSSVEDKLMVLQGWIPAAKQDEVTSNLAGTEAYYEISDPQPDDDIPILLENKGIFAWFEPIVKLYMLPKYNELDLTPFFAPFFMVFFGLCLGDSGYGLFLFLAATLY